MRPTRTVQREDPIAQQRVEFLMSVSKAEVLELSSQQRLEVLGVDGRDDVTSEDFLGEGASVYSILLSKVLDPSLLLHGDSQPVECRDTEKETGRACRSSLAMQGLGLLAVVVQLLEVAEDQKGHVDRAEQDKSRGGEHLPSMIELVNGYKRGMGVETPLAGGPGRRDLKYQPMM